jgi:hypothetical protein
LAGESSKNDILKQLTEAFSASREQLEDLKVAVARTTELAQIKLESSFLFREKDKSFRDFGEAVWGLVKNGKLTLPTSLEPAATAVRRADTRLQSQLDEVRELLKEGNEVADRQKGKSKEGVASKVKKR